MSLKSKNILLKTPIILYLAALTFVSGCSQLGPKFIEGSRTQYNIAMSRTEGEQMLLNLVRLRYGDAPYFLEATALNTQFLLAPSAEASSVLDFNGNNSYGLKGKFAYEEKPTVTYTPLRGENFVRKVLSQISLDTIVLLDSSGWSTERVLSLSVENLNGLDNASQASGPTPLEAPNYKEFQTAVATLERLQNKGELQFKPTHDNNASRYSMTVNQTSENRFLLIKLAELLKLNPRQSNYPLVQSSYQASGNTVDIRTRSFMGVMYFLSQAVKVPEDHVNSGRVRVTLDSSGLPFDWTEVTGDLLTIEVSEEAPSSYAVAVEYRNKWFYVSDNDIQSKSTLQLLAQLFALQSQESTNSSPVLTLPIGG
jgi:hypothetical protein